MESEFDCVTPMYHQLLLIFFRVLEVCCVQSECDCDSYLPSAAVDFFPLHYGLLLLLVYLFFYATVSLSDSKKIPLYYALGNFFLSLCTGELLLQQTLKTEILVH